MTGSRIKVEVMEEAAARFQWFKPQIFGQENPRTDRTLRKLIRATVWSD